MKNFGVMSNRKTGPSAGDIRQDQKKHKGQELQSHQKGAPAMNRKDAGKHEKDDSEGAEQNTTKKQENSI
jgi:hypothetical protein